MTSSHAHRVAANVRAELARRRIAQSVVAEKLGTSQAAVSRRLLGAVPFDVAEIQVIAELLDLPVAQLLAAAAAVESASA